MDKKLEAELMSQTANWPQYPLLPVKRRRKGYTQIGLIISAFGAQVHPIVYLANLWDFSLAKLDHIEKLVYPDFDRLVDDGWVVD